MFGISPFSFDLLSNFGEETSLVGVDDFVDWFSENEIYVSEILQGAILP